MDKDNIISTIVLLIMFLIFWILFVKIVTAVFTN